VSRVAGKVAVITGAARGQGRNHAVRLAQEGADIIAIDICEDLPGGTYPLGTAADLAETVHAVEACDRRIVAIKADVRVTQQLASALDEGVAELGHLDIVVANAGICMLGPDVTMQGFFDTIATNLSGVINTVHAAFSHLGAGASIICTGSTAAMLPGRLDSADNPALGYGAAAYKHSKRGVARFVHDLAVELAPQSIRVNAIHPTNANTDMLHNREMYRLFRPDIAEPTRAEAEEAFLSSQPMPIPYVELSDVTNAVLYLASDESRYVTGLQLKVDGGATLRTSTSGAPG
jgi:SDR family mycofactocin-dependent oxidoreductase